MIESARILIPYQENLAYGKGDLFLTEGKNVFITGDNGTGKSCLLFSLAHSYWRSNEFDKGEETYMLRPFPRYLRQSLTEKDGLRRRRETSNKIAWMLPQVQTDTRLLRDYRLNKVLENMDLFPYTGTQEQLAAAVRKSARLGLHKAGTRIAQEYLAFIPAFAAYIGQPVDRAYGVLQRLEEESAFRVDVPVTRFLLTQITGDLSRPLIAHYAAPGEEGIETCCVNAQQIAVPSRIGTGSDDRGQWIRWHRSKGELQRATLERIFAAGPAYTLLDEPLQHLDEAGQDEMEQRLQEDTSTQYFIATHDRALKRGLRANSRWIEWALRR